MMYLTSGFTVFDRVVAARGSQLTAAFLILAADVLGQFSSLGLVSFKEVLRAGHGVPHSNHEHFDFYVSLIDPVCYIVLMLGTASAAYVARAPAVIAPPSDCLWAVADTFGGYFRPGGGKGRSMQWRASASRVQTTSSPLCCSPKTALALPGLSRPGTRMSFALQSLFPSGRPPPPRRHRPPASALIIRACVAGSSAASCDALTSGCTSRAPNASAASPSTRRFASTSPARTTRGPSGSGCRSSCGPRCGRCRWIRATFTARCRQLQQMPRPSTSTRSGPLPVRRSTPTACSPGVSPNACQSLSASAPSGATTRSVCGTSTAPSVPLRSSRRGWPSPLTPSTARTSPTLPRWADTLRWPRTHCS